MQLQQLYENFSLATPERQQAMLALYRLRRAEDMAKTSTYRKKRVSTAKAKPELTEQEKIVMNLLGLKPKDIFALREITDVSTGGEEEGADDGAELFIDPIYEEDEE